MILFWTMFTGSAYAQQAVAVKQPLYPYLSKDGLFGFADEHLTLQIPPKYKAVSLFTRQGYSVVTDSLGKKGVIDIRKGMVLPITNESIQLFELDDFTLAAVSNAYYSRLRFWEWKFLPGFNLMGTGNDKRLFDTKVKRIKKTVFILGGKNQKVKSARITPSGYYMNNFNISILDNNQVLIDGALYKISSKGARLMTKGIQDTLAGHRFAQRRGNRLYILDRDGNPVGTKGYALLDSLEFIVNDLPHTVQLNSSGFQAICRAYKDEEGKVFIYPDFSKQLPRILSGKLPENDSRAEDVIRGIWRIAAIPGSDYFLFMHYQDGKRIFWFLDRQGNWHANLPSEVPFTVTLPSGDILWPQSDRFISDDQVPDQWEIRTISRLGESSGYRIAIGQGKTTRQGIWDIDKNQWLIRPKYYQVYPLGDNKRRWAFQPEKSGLWGIMDQQGEVLVKPVYYSITREGWVQLQENGRYISFYLDLKTLRPFREK